jgi:hypothetical protein
VTQEARHEHSEARTAREIGAIGREIHAGEDDFPETGLEEPPRFLDQRPDADAARWPASERNDAEGTAMVADCAAVSLTAMMSFTVIRSAPFRKSAA